MRERSWVRLNSFFGGGGRGVKLRKSGSPACLLSIRTFNFVRTLVTIRDQNDIVHDKEKIERPKQKQYFQVFTRMASILTIPICWSSDYP